MFSGPTLNPPLYWPLFIWSPGACCPITVSAVKRDSQPIKIAIKECFTGLTCSAEGPSCHSRRRERCPTISLTEVTHTALLWSRKLRTASKSTRYGQVAVLGKHEDVVRAGRLPTRWRRFLEGSGDLWILDRPPSTRLGRPRAPQSGEGPVRGARPTGADV